LSSRREREAPLGGGRAKIENSSRRHPRKFGQKRFLAVRRSWPGNGVACLWATSLEKIFGGVIAIISLRPGGRMQQSAVLRCAILLVGSAGGTGNETARVHLGSRWCGGGIDPPYAAPERATDPARYRHSRPHDSRGVYVPDRRVPQRPDRSWLC